MPPYLERQAGIPQGDDPSEASSGSRSPLLGVLRQVDIFHDVPRRSLERIAAACREVAYEAGEMIVRENTPGEKLYVIMEGAVEVLIDPGLFGVEVTSVRPTVIATLWSGQIFGEIGLVDQGMSSASVRAASDGARLQALQRSYLLDLCEQDTELGYRLMRNIASGLAFKIRNTDLMLRQRILWEGTSEET